LRGRRRSRSQVAVAGLVAGLVAGRGRWSWKVSCVVSERLKFVERCQAGESMSSLCREFGISRKSGYKFVDRFEKWGEAGLLDSSRRPRHIVPRWDYAFAVRCAILRPDDPPHPRSCGLVFEQRAL
jgi:hypothetical protein